MLALAAGLSIFSLLLLLGVLHPIIISNFAETWRQALAYAVTAGLTILVSWTVLVLVRVRPTVSASVNAAITTVTLTKQSETYFDAYLDEIVYFFEATKYDIVIIEDIDRFEDAEVFDTLRSLNGLLNNSGQVGRRVVFVYAIRDSVFELIGQRTDTTTASERHPAHDQAKEALKRASRTKFFDVVIPVVPFISPDNARDVMSKAMKSKDYKISPGLIRLAARHVADMRLIHNIRNEFEVHRNQLIKSHKSIPDITDDLVFAIVLFKNTHLGEYEKIWHRSSALDRLYVAWRELVSAELLVARMRISDLRTTQQNALKASDRAKRLRSRLLRLRDDLSEAAPSSYTVTLDDDLEAELESTRTWAQITADDELTLDLTRNNGVTTSFTFSRAALERLLGEIIDPAVWEQVDGDETAEEIRALEDRARFLQHHTWAELLARTDVTTNAEALHLTEAEMDSLRTSKARRIASRTPAGMDPNADVLVSFAELAAALLPSELARELVRHGFITSHFALYASRYYGKHLSEQAREYIYRCIGPGEPDSSFNLTRRDVRQILREQEADKADDADLFSDPSILNVSIVDHLLAERPGAAVTVARQIASFGPGRREFLDTYMTQGTAPTVLLTHLAPHWTGILTYVATSSSVPSEIRTAGLDGALAAATGPDGYHTNEDLALLLQEQYKFIPALTDPASSSAAERVFGIASDAGALIEDLHPLNAAALNAVVKLGLFAVTESNIRVLVPQGKVLLSELRADPPLYVHILNNLRSYLDLVDNNEGAFGVVSDSPSFVTLINDLADLSDDLLESVIEVCPAEVRIDDISTIPTKAWTAIVGTRRTLPTFRNVLAYLDEYGVDWALAKLLKGRTIRTPNSADADKRQRLAYAILAASDLIPSTLARVETVMTLKPGTLDPSLLQPESGDLIARLLKARLIPDDESALTAPLMLDWPTLEKTIKVSMAFRRLAATALPIAWVPQFIRSSVPTREQKLAVIALLEEYLNTATVPQTRAIASALVERRWTIRTSRILALAKAGAPKHQIVALAANHGNSIDQEELRQILRALGGDYQRVADGAKGWPSFPSDAAHRTVLEQFIGDTVKRVENKHFKLQGDRLVARLG